MAASTSNKPVGLQITLVFFVILTLILAIVSYLFHSQYSTAAKDRNDANLELGNVRKQFGNAQTNIDELKKLIGLNMSEIASPTDPNDATTLTGAGKNEINKAGTNSGADLVKTLANTLAALNSTEEGRAQVAAKLSELDVKYLDQENRYRTTAEEHIKKWQKAEADLRDVTQKRDEQLAAKDQELRDVQKEKLERETEIQTLTEQMQKNQKRYTDELVRLEGINDRLREDLDKLKHVTFERADGQITRVDYTTGMVYLNLGSADHLRERVTFSVYPKETSGIGGAPEAIKGMVEVVKILDAHSSVAKIRDEDIFRPLSKGDQIYSPLWNAGRPELFSFVGLIDLDGDGRDTRYLLHDIIKTAGAEIDNEVDNDGNRIPEEGSISELTKFLVVGDIPDPAKYQTEDRDKPKKINEKFKDLQKEARLNGVRIISLNDFLQYIGYKPGHRLYHPGQERKYTAEDAVNPNSRKRESEGTVSGSHNRKPGTKQIESRGSNSKLFGPNRGY